MNAPNPLSPDKHSAEAKGYEPSMEEILASIRRIIADDQAFSQRPIPAQQPSAQAEPLSEPASPQEPMVSAQTKISAESKIFAEPKTFAEPKPAAEPRLPGASRSLAELERTRGAAGQPQASTEAKPAAQSPAAPSIPAASRPSLTERRPLIREKVAASAAGAEVPSSAPGFPVDTQFQVFKTAVRPLTGVARPAESLNAGAPDLERHGAADARAERPEESPNLAGAFLQGQLPEPASDDDMPLVSPKTDATVASAFEALVASRFLQSSEGLNDIIREMARPMLKAWLDDNLPILVERLVRAEIERVARGGH